MTKLLEAFNELAKQPYWIIALILGAALVAFPEVTIDKDYHLIAHPPSTFSPVVVGIALLIFSSVSFGFTLLSKGRAATDEISDGFDLTQVKESDGALWTSVNGCEIRVVNGSIEDHAHTVGSAIVLPCNEYFDDRCVGDTRSALGAYVNRVFDGRAPAFVSLIKAECRKRLGPGVEQQKTDSDRAESFGAGRCILLINPLDHSMPVALVSTTTQRAGEGLAARMSYLFNGMRELVSCLADERLSEVVMPILGAGKGGLDPPLAFVGLLLAVAEAARYGQGGQRLKRVTIVVFRHDAGCTAQVDHAVVRRALALIGSPN